MNFLKLSLNIPFQALSKHKIKKVTVLANEIGWAQSYPIYACTSANHVRC